MHVVYLVYSYSPNLGSPDELLERFITTRAWAEALASAGADVTVVQRFSRDAILRNVGVTYRFVADSCSPRLRSWEVPRRCHAEVSALADEGTVVHVNGLLFPLQLRALSAQLPPAVRIVVQHHAERPWPRHRRFVQRAGLRVADGFLFASAELAAPWRSTRLISGAQPCFEVMECPMTFQRTDRRQAREITGMSGHPVVLWVGNLNDRKDPLVVLNGFDEVLTALPNARLYMVYADAPLLSAVRARIANSVRLRASVELVGPLQHERLQDVYNSSDYFVLGSHSEGSGYALAEAMACGVVPVVTDIPSFRSMTQGVAGTLWNVGDAHHFASTFLAVAGRALAAESERVLRIFRDNLGPEAVARRALAAYRQVCASRGAFA